MDGTNYLLLKNNFNLFLLYKQGFRDYKKYLETIEKKLNSTTKNLYQNGKKYVEIHLEIIVIIPSPKGKNNVCLTPVFPTLYICQTKGE